MAKAGVTVRGTFVARKPVRLFHRVGDWFAPTGDVVASQKASKDGDVTFSSLEEGAAFWAAQEIDGEWRYRAVTAKVSPERQQVARDPVHGAQSIAPHQPANTTRVRGHLVTDAEAANPLVGDATPKGDRVAEPQPHVRQEDIPAGTPQRSATLTGEATPKDPNEQQPRPTQDDVSGPQRSDTEVGEATPKPKGEQVPQARQEDVPRNLPQRSATETGAAEPKPTGSLVEIEKVKDDSAVAATGATVAKAGTSKTKRPTSGKATKAAAKRATAKKRGS